MWQMKEHWDESGHLKKSCMSQLMIILFTHTHML